MSVSLQITQTTIEAGITTTRKHYTNPHRKFFCFFSFKKRRENYYSN